MSKKIIIYCCIALLGMTTATFAISHNNKLQQINNKIAQVKTNLKNTQTQQLSVQQQLKIIAKKIKTLEKSYKTTKQQLFKEKTTLQQLTLAQNNEQLQLQKTEQTLINQIITAYKIPKSTPLKTLLNQENATNYTLPITYHKYVLEARKQQLHELSATLARIAKNKEQIEKQTKILQNLEVMQQKQQTELKATNKERNKLLASLNIKIKNQSNDLQKLLVAKENLEKLITQLSKQKFVVPRQTMLQLCTTFIWPTQGNITVHFGSAIEHSSWQWNGTLIAAPEGQTVKAITAGKVVYANWLSGYGNLLIIDHGNGYMSLYGRNHSLYKAVGSYVKAGEVIASVGNSGGFDEPALYFGIRYNSKAVNPETWCK